VLLFIRTTPTGHAPVDTQIRVRSAIGQSPSLLRHLPRKTLLARYGRGVNRNPARVVLGADLVSLSVAVIVASAIVLESWLPWNSGLPTTTPIPMIIALYLGATIGEIVARQMWKTAARRPSYVRAILVATTALIVVSMSALVTRFYWSRPYLFVTLVVWLVLMLILRAIWRSGPWEERYVVISSNKVLTDELNAAPHAIVEASVPPDAHEVPEIGRSMIVLVESGATYSDEVARSIAQARRSGVTVRPFAEVYEEHTGKVSIVHERDGWHAPMSIEARAGYSPFKRVLDVTGTIVVAPLALIATAIAVIWVKMDSQGSGLFYQQRVGYEGAPFTIYKIRTMTPLDSTAAVTTADQDIARITRAGRILRRLRIDELPQLWNVLKGDLSIIGPRPEQVELAESFDKAIPFYAERHIVRPGITGWAQVHHGYASGVEETVEKLGFDLFYVKHMSFWLDLRIVGRSVWTVISGFGAK